MEKVISKTEYNRKDHKKFYRFHMFHRSKSTYFILFIVLFVIVWTIYNTINAQGEEFSSIMILWAISAFTIMLIPMMMILQINNIVKKESQERKDSIDIVTANKHKIEKNSSHVEGKVVIGWHQVDAVYENREFIYIYTGPQQGIFIKKEDIIEGDVATFRKLAENNMKKNRKGKVKYRIRFRENKDEQ